MTTLISEEEQKAIIERLGSTPNGDGYLEYEPVQPLFEKFCKSVIDAGEISGLTASNGGDRDRINAAFAKWVKKNALLVYDHLKTYDADLLDMLAVANEEYLTTLTKK